MRNSRLSKVGFVFSDISGDKDNHWEEIDNTEERLTQLEGT